MVSLKGLRSGRCSGGSSTLLAPPPFQFPARPAYEFYMFSTWKQVFHCNIIPRKPPQAAHLALRCMFVYCIGCLRGSVQQQKGVLVMRVYVCVGVYACIFFFTGCYSHLWIVMKTGAEYEKLWRSVLHVCLQASRFASRQVRGRLRMLCTMGHASMLLYEGDLRCNSSPGRRTPTLGCSALL